MKQVEGILVHSRNSHSCYDTGKGGPREQEQQLRRTLQEREWDKGGKEILSRIYSGRVSSGRGMGGGVIGPKNREVS